MRKPPTPKDHPLKDQHMVSASQYYRDRADIQRGLKKRDFPSLNVGKPSEKTQEKMAETNSPPTRK